VENPTDTNFNFVNERVKNLLTKYGDKDKKIFIEKIQQKKFIDLFNEKKDLYDKFLLYLFANYPALFDNPKFISHLNTSLVPNNIAEFVENNLASIDGQYSKKLSETNSINFDSIEKDSLENCKNNFEGTRSPEKENTQISENKETPKDNSDIESNLENRKDSQLSEKEGTQINENKEAPKDNDNIESKKARNKNRNHKEKNYKKIQKLKNIGLYFNIVFFLTMLVLDSIIDISTILHFIIILIPFFWTVLFNNIKGGGKDEKI
jgi:hypothetical protein